MRWWQRLLFRRRQERQLDDELRFHLDLQVAKYVRGGMSEEEARRRTRLDFGGLEQVKDDCRDVRRMAWLETTVRDILFAVRSLRKSPAFAAAAVCTLALGIGANTAIFSVVNAVFLRPLPYREPERLVWAAGAFPRFRIPMTMMPDVAAWRSGQTVFEFLEAWGMTLGRNLASPGRPARRVQVGRVTPRFFAMLGVQPQLGAGFAADEDPHNRVAVISGELWREHFQSDNGIAGQAIELDGDTYTIVGVMPPRFVYPGGADTGVWLPDAVTPEGSVPSRSMKRLSVIGRLKPGVTEEQARANLEVIMRRMDGLYPAPWGKDHAEGHARVVPLQRHLTGGAQTSVYVLMGAVGLLLLIVCANVANLMMGRGIKREREIAVRVALGASRGRLLRLLLMESLVLATGGGALGMAIMAGCVSGLGFLVPDALARGIPVDQRVLGFALACSAGTGLVFGLAPAWTVSRLDVHTSLKESGAHPAGRRRRSRASRTLVVAQLALSLVLLAGAGLLLRSFLALMAVNSGFDPRNVLVAEVALAPVQVYRPTRQVAFFRRVLEEIRRVPGVEYAGVADSPPMAPFMKLESGLHAEGEPETRDAVCPTSASEGYFEALRIPLLAGRTFDARDTSDSPRVAIINQSLARVLFKDRDPVGRRVATGAGLVTVVGLVGDIRHTSLEERVFPELFRPYTQAPTPWMTLAVRSTLPPGAIAEAVRKAVRAVDPAQPVFNAAPLPERVARTAAQRRARALMTGVFAAIALLIAAVGVYGVMAYSVTRRTHEIGVRLALGARPKNVRWMVVGEGLRMAAIGLLVGLAGALVLTRALRTFLFGVTATDGATFVFACLVLTGAAFLASYFPARRATRVDPLVALRHQ